MQRGGLGRNISALLQRSGSPHWGKRERERGTQENTQGDPCSKDTWKEAQHHSSGKYTSILQWDYHHTSVGRAKSHKTGNNWCCQGWSEKETLWHCGWECQQLQPLWKTAQGFINQMLRIRLPWGTWVAQSGDWLLISTPVMISQSWDWALVGFCTGKMEFAWESLSVSLCSSPTSPSLPFK